MIKCRYVNPAGIIAGYWTGNWRVFLLLTAMAFVFVRKIGKIQSGIKAAGELTQIELNAAQKECDIRLRNLNAEAANAFTRKLVTNLKAIKKDVPRERGSEGNAKLKSK